MITFTKYLAEEVNRAKLVPDVKLTTKVMNIGTSQVTMFSLRRT